MSKYHIRDKFVIEIDEVFENNADDFIHEKELYRIKGFNSLVFDDNGLDKLQKYETYKPSELEEFKKEAYNKGLEDAIELARKLYEMPIHRLEQIFDGHIHMTDVLDNYDYIEILAKLKAYEKVKEIKVGDEISVLGNEIKGYVIDESKEYEDCYVVLITNYKDLRTAIYNKTVIEKTGKHIDISSILEQIGGGE